MWSLVVGIMREAMTVGPTPLSYSTVPPPPARRRRWMHVLALPAVWLPGAYLSSVYYGDEYGALAVANLPALGVLNASGLMDYVNAAGSMAVVIGALVAVGAAILAAVGCGPWGWWACGGGRTSRSCRCGWP